MRTVGTRLRVQLPGAYHESGQDGSASAEVVDVPFRPSVNPNSREVAHAKGRDSVE